MARAISLDKDSVGKLILNFSIPAVTGMLVTALYAIIDGIFIGQGAGADGLAALNIAYPIVNLGAALSLMFGTGGATLISLYPKNKRLQNKCFSYIVTLNIISYFFLLLLVIIFNEKLMFMMGANENLLPLVKQYMYPCTFALVFLMLANSLNAVVRNDKAPVYAFISMVIGAVANTFLDWLFIMVFHWGVFGGAVATGIGQLLSLLFLIKYFYRVGSNFKYKFQRFQIGAIFKIFMIGFPSFIMEFAVALTLVLFNKLFMEYSGEMGVSAFCIVAYVFYIFRMLFAGLGQGIQPVISYNYGIKAMKRVKKALKISQKTAFVLSIIILIWVIFFGKHLIKLFNDDLQLIALATHGLILYCSAMIFLGINFVNISYLQSKGLTRYANFLSILRSTVFVIIPLIILPKILGTNGIWLALPFSDFFTFLIGILVMKRAATNY